MAGYRKQDRGLASCRRSRKKLHATRALLLMWRESIRLIDQELARVEIINSHREGEFQR